MQEGLLRKGEGAEALRGWLEQGHPRPPKQGSRAMRGGEELGQGQGRVRSSCTVFWALYIRLRYS